MMRLPFGLALLLCASSFAQAQPESFDSFLYTFCTQADVRTERTTWPLPYTYVDYAGDGEERTESLGPDDEDRLWALEFDDCYSGSNTRQVFDNFDLELRDTGRRVVSFLGNETSVDYALFFERREARWYLVRVVDRSF
jgi:hypothetical protein